MTREHRTPARAVLAVLALVGLAAGAAALAFASRASAQWIVWEPPSGRGDLARAVVATCAERGVAATMDPEPGLADLGGDIAAADVDWLASADREIALVREELAALDEAGALARLERLLAETLEHPAVHGVVARRVEALLLRATVLASRGQRAADDFADVARLDAERRLAAAEAAPAVREQAEDARSLALAETGVLRVEPNAPAADVYLDDVLLGPAPIRVGPIAAGRHVLRVEAPAHETYAAWIDVTPGEPRTVAPSLEPVAELAAWRRGNDALRRGGGRIAADVPWAWLIVRGGRGGRVALRGCAATLDRCSAWVRTTRDELTLPDAPSTWTSPRGTPAATDERAAAWLAARPRSSTRTPRPRPRRWYERPWVWAIAATVVVGAGVTASIAAASSDGAAPRTLFVEGGIRPTE